MLKKFVLCRFKLDGLHCWPGAVSPVSYLANKHRHIFNICLKFQVENNDREIEFIQTEARVKGYLLSKYWNDNIHIVDFEAMSCEDIAQELIEKFGACSCSVFEDVDGGAEIVVG